MSALLASYVSPEFTALPQKEVDRLRRLIRILEVIHGEKNKTLAYQRYASGKRLSAASLKRIYLKWRASGFDWEVLVDKNAIRETNKKLPDEFIEFFIGLAEKNQRKIAPAWRHVIHLWQAGKDKIPGYEELPPDCGKGYPAGWSKRNLTAQVKDKYALKVSRRGRAAAASLRPTVRTTRVALRVGQILQFDDMWHDLIISVPGRSRSVARPLEFGCLDVLSACRFAHGIKPRLKGQEGKYEVLNKRDFLFFLIGVLTQYGYRQDEIGTTLVLEHGTAAIHPDMDADLSDYLGIKVQRSSMEGRQQPGQYEGRGKGNFRFKAELESLHNLIHNEFAFLAGQTGRNRDNAPEALHGLVKYEERLLRASEVLSPERAAMLEHEILNLHQFIQVATELHHRVNSRTDHKLEGWQECGFFINEYFVGGKWLTGEQLALPAPALEAIAANSQIMSRKLSPSRYGTLGERNSPR